MARLMHVGMTTLLATNVNIWCSIIRPFESNIVC